MHVRVPLLSSRGDIIGGCYDLSDREVAQSLHRGYIYQLSAVIDLEIFDVRRERCGGSEELRSPRRRVQAGPPLGENASVAPALRVSLLEGKLHHGFVSGIFSATEVRRRTWRNTRAILKQIGAKWWR